MVNPMAAKMAASRFIVDPPDGWAKLPWRREEGESPLEI
jgi:hypothetical protein